MMTQIKVEKPDTQIIGKKILVLTAHPDDESFLAAGTLHKNQLADGQSFLICATLGEKGSSHLSKSVSETELSEIRRQELENAVQVIGINHLVNLGLPDGGLDSHEAKLDNLVASELNKLNPDLIMSFGLDGATGHRDHIAVAKSAQRISEKLGLPLLQFCFPNNVVEEMKQWLIQRRAQLTHYEDDYELTRGDVVVSIDGSIKLQALHCYASQIDQTNPFAGFPEHVVEAMLAEECFKLIE